MMKTNKPPSFLPSFFIILLGGAAIFCGIDAIMSESVTTPSKYAGDESKRVYGIKTIYVGVGWIMFGAALVNKVIASHIGISYEQIITIGLFAVGGISWLLIFI